MIGLVSEKEPRTAMQADIADKLDALADLFRRHGVARLELFGSAARDDFDPSRSDADFLVTFQPAVRNDIGAVDDLKEALVQACAIGSSMVMERSASIWSGWCSVIVLVP
jgi:predicted nucleotidyltransferase